MTKIRPDCIKKPANPIPRNYKPPNSQIQKVGRGINFVKIADELTKNKNINITPWALIRYNFPSISEKPSQQGACEVNWYLQEYLGCTLVTSDRKNYLFDNSMKRPYIYIPATHYKFDDHIIEVDAPTYAWGGFGFRAIYSQGSHFETNTFEDISGVLFSLDKYPNNFGIHCIGSSTGLKFKPLPSPTITVVALIATGIIHPIMLHGYNLKGGEFILSLGPIGGELKAISKGWKLRKIGKVIVKAGITAATWEKSRGLFLEAIKTIPKIDLKSRIPKLHVINLYSFGMPEIGYMLNNSNVKITWISV